MDISDIHVTVSNVANDSSDLYPSALIIGLDKAAILFEDKDGIFVGLRVRTVVFQDAKCLIVNVVFHFVAHLVLIIYAAIAQCYRN